MFDPSEPMRVRDIRAAGATRHQVDRLLPRTFWGVRGVRDDFSIPVRCAEFIPRLPKMGFYSHVTAAILWGVPLPGPLEMDLDLHVSVPVGRRAPDAAQIIGHQVAVGPDDVVLLDGMRVSSPARTWRELASILDGGDLVAAGDALIYHGRELTNISELRMVALRERTYPGRRYAREALPHLSNRAESRAESLLRIALWRAGLPALLVNHEIRDASGILLGRVDLLFRDFPVAVEYDGDHHRTDLVQWRRDVHRLGDLEDAGIAVVRVTGDDFPSFGRAIDRCRTLLARRGWQP